VLRQAIWPPVEDPPRSVPFSTDIVDALERWRELRDEITARRSSLGYVPRVEAAHLRAAAAHERAAALHEQAAELFDGSGLPSRARDERAHARLDREGAKFEREGARLRRERNLTRELEEGT
jgi:hypothetical protein